MFYLVQSCSLHEGWWIDKFINCITETVWVLDMNCYECKHVVIRLCDVARIDISPGWRGQVLSICYKCV